MGCRVKEKAGRFVEDMIDIRLEEIQETDEAYQDVALSVAEVLKDVYETMEQLDESQREILSDYEQRKDIMEREKGRCLYLAGVKDGVRLAKYLEIND